MSQQKSIAVLLACVALMVLPALAQNVGTATAVNPTSRGAAPNVDFVTLQVGMPVVHKERIQTTSSGTVQLLFLDKSTLSIGPNTNILIDEFVYDPNSHTGHMVATLSEGAFRMVGGYVSHEGGATVKTPVAVIGIRGGVMTMAYHRKQGGRVIDHHGTITYQNGCGSGGIGRSGFAVTIAGWNTCPEPPQRVSEAEIAYYLKLLTSGPGQNGGVPGLHKIDIGGVIGPDTLPVPNGVGESDAFQLIIQATQNGTGRGRRIPPRGG